MAVNLIVRLKVDRIAFNYLLPSHNLYKFAWAQVCAIATEPDLFPGMKLCNNGHHFGKRLAYKPNDQQVADVEVYPGYAGSRYFRIGLYPDHGTLEQLAFFAERLGIFLPDLSYEVMFNCANITYLELAADNRSQLMHSFIPFHSNTACSNIYLEDNFDLGTIYLGSKLSSRRFRIYDKRREQIANGFAPKYPVHTRIEAICKSLGCSAPQLIGQLQNPFAKLEIADRTKARAAASTPAHHYFLDGCEQVGAPLAFAELKKCQRAAARDLLRSAKATWWNPQHVFSMLPNAIATISPAALDQSG